MESTPHAAGSGCRHRIWPPNGKPISPSRSPGSARWSDPFIKTNPRPARFWQARDFAQRLWTCGDDADLQSLVQASAEGAAEFRLCWSRSSVTKNRSRSPEDIQAVTKSRTNPSPFWLAWRWVEWTKSKPRPRAKRCLRHDGSPPNLTPFIYACFHFVHRLAVAARPATSPTTRRQPNTWPMNAPSWRGCVRASPS